MPAARPVPRTIDEPVATSLPLSRAEQGTWPLLDDPADPWAEPWPDDDLGYADLRGLDPDLTLTEVDYRRAASDLQDLLSDLLRGARPYEPSVLRATAAAARVRLDDDRVDTRPVAIGPAPVTAEEVARIALDQDPAAGLFGPDAALGRWAILARSDSPRDRRTLRYALAHWAAGRPTEPPPIQRWRRANVAPDRRDRAAVVAVVRAPLGLWRVDTLDADGRAALSDTLGLAPHRCPAHPIPLGHAGGFGRVEIGGHILARLVATAGPTFYAFAPLALPSPPDPAFVRAALTVLLARQRLRARRATPADALRDQAALFCRLVHEALPRPAEPAPDALPRPQARPPG